MLHMYFFLHSLNGTLSLIKLPTFGSYVKVWHILVELNKLPFTTVFDPKYLTTLISDQDRVHTEHRHIPHAVNKLAK